MVMLGWGGWHNRGGEKGAGSDEYSQDRLDLFMIDGLDINAKEKRQRFLGMLCFHLFA